MLCYAQNIRYLEIRVKEHPVDELTLIGIFLHDLIDGPVRNISFLRNYIAKASNIVCGTGGVYHEIM